MNTTIEKPLDYRCFLLGIIIGGGLAGLMAASVAASRKQKVTVLTYGSGSLRSEERRAS